MASTTDSLDRHTLRALVDASTAINEEMEEALVYESIAEQARKILKSEGASILTYRADSDELEFRVALGPVGQDLIGERFSAKSGIAGFTLTEKDAVYVNDVANDQKFFKGIDDKFKQQTRALMAAPMIHKNHALGVLEVLNPIGREGFSDADLELLKVFSNLAASAAAHAIKLAQSENENKAWRRAVGQPVVVGQSDAFARAFKLCMKVAKANSTVLLNGETGTGKEVAARSIHAHSPRADKPFVPVNCAALPENLLESELFGHEKGAFTGATQARPGRFELADGGTLFLDEVGELPLPMQAKLLRIIQEREFERVGGTKSIKVDVRIICATHRDLKADAEAGEFREDLYYRLSVFPIQLPPLRERKEDIPMLVEQFVEDLARDMGMGKMPPVSDAAMQCLCNYDWPGNIRELRNAIERSILMCDDEILVEDLAGDIQNNQGLQSKGLASVMEASDSGMLVSADAGLETTEKALILDAMEKSNWNQTAAAELLGITRDKLRYRLKRHDISKPD